MSSTLVACGGKSWSTSSQWGLQLRLVKKHGGTQRWQELLSAGERVDLTAASGVIHPLLLPWFINPSDSSHCTEGCCEIRATSPRRQSRIQKDWSGLERRDANQFVFHWAPHCSGWTVAFEVSCYHLSRRRVSDRSYAPSATSGEEMIRAADWSIVSSEERHSVEPKVTFSRSDAHVGAWSN